MVSGVCCCIDFKITAEMTVGHSQESSSDGSASPHSSPKPQGLKVRDPTWLKVQVCHDFVMKQCTRSEWECHFAHPDENCTVENGKVTACFDAMKGRCQRETCKYFHPPKQIKTHLESLGKSFQFHKVQTFQKDHVIPFNTMPHVDARLPNLTLGHWIPKWQNSEQQPVKPPSPRSPNLPRRLDKSDKLEICSDFMNNNCQHQEHVCPFAHPPSNIIACADGYITVCMDYMKGDCQRISCRYFHPPPHLQARVKAAQRRPAQVFNPFMPGNISPVIHQQIRYTPAMALPPPQIPLSMHMHGAGSLPPLIPVSPDIFYPMNHEGQYVVQIPMPAQIPTYIWPTAEPMMMAMPPPEGIRQISGMSTAFIETMTPPATP